MGIYTPLLVFRTVGFSGADIRNLVNESAIMSETAISVFYPREDMIDQGYTTFGYMKMKMVVAHGGRCAEHLIFGDDITDGGTDDLEKITKIAREMVISPQNARLGLTALTRRVGLMDQPDSSDGGLIKYRWDDPHVIPANMPLEVSELFTRELARLITYLRMLVI